MASNRIPRHVGFIPDGNRRWAERAGMAKHEGYTHGIEPGLLLCDQCRAAGVEEVSIYCFTKDNTKRASVQKEAFTAASVAFARQVIARGAAVMVVGDDKSPNFPAELAYYRERRGGGIKVNLLINYDWQWDLDGLRDGHIRSEAVSRLDLVVRWGGGRRLSGFLPVQCVFEDDYWPDFKPDHFDEALLWFGKQDRTLGG